MYEVLVNRLGGLSLPGKSVVRLNDRPDMTLDVYRGRYTTTTTSAHCPNTTEKKAYENTCYVKLQIIHACDCRLYSLYFSMSAAVQEYEHQIDV